MNKIILSILLTLIIPVLCYATSGYPQKAKVTNQTLTTAGVEYQVTLPNGTSGFTMQSRTAADFKWGTGSNESGSAFYTVKSGTVYSTPTTLGMGPITPNTTLFLQSATASQVVEIVSWQ